ncbi:MAG: hypothetical protein ACLRVT_02145 [Oscillospiraceae bacterium]
MPKLMRWIPDSPAFSRMQLGGAVADYKREHSLAVMNSQRDAGAGRDPWWGGLAPDARVLFASMMI